VHRDVIRRRRPRERNRRHADVNYPGSSDLNAYTNRNTHSGYPHPRRLALPVPVGARPGRRHHPGAHPL